MEIMTLDSNLKVIGDIDIFKSMLWVDKFDGFGEVELIMVPTTELVTKLLGCSYLALAESEHLMILDTLNIKTDPVDGNRLIAKGISLESILRSRHISTPIRLDGNFQTGIQQILNETILNPTNTDRDIANFEYLASSDPAITALTVDAQFLGESVYEAISNLCLSKDVGFKVTLVNGNFRFSLYAGVDRSYDQTTNPYIIFSPHEDNLINGDFLFTTRLRKTVAYVAGEYGIGNERSVIEVASPAGGGTGLNRFEIFVNAQGITATTQEGTLSEAEYTAKLEAFGREELSKNTIIKSFEGEIDTSDYAFGVDFGMGDILQTADRYGNSAKSRVSEMVFFQDSGKISKYPTFRKVS